MKKNRIIWYFVIGIGVMFLPSIFKILKSIWKFIVEDNGYVCFWTSIFIVFLCFFVEYFYSYRHLYDLTGKENKNTEVSPFYYDSPTSEDILNRGVYAKLLIDKVLATFYCIGKPIKHSFVIHIGEHYGQGKTSFLMMLDKEIKKRNKSVINIKFEPWLCDTEIGIVDEFFDTFRIKVGEYLPRLDGVMKQYLRLLLSAITYEKKGFSIATSPFFDNGSTLKETHDQIRDELTKIDRPIIITIDDVDRLQNKELMMVLKIIRDTADFPNVFYIIAADNLHLNHMLKSMNIDAPDIYLKKFFNLEFQLPANESVAFKELIKLLKKKFLEIAIKPHLINIYITKIRKVNHIEEAFLNMRDVYRFVNTYFLAIESKENVDQLDLFDLFLITLVQTLNMEYYLQLRDHSLYLLDVKRSGNDILLQWKGDLNVVQIKQNKKALAHVEEVEASEFNKPRKEQHSEDINVPVFEETIQKTIITPNDILPEIMNILFGQGTQNVSANRACRHNMFFKYFSNSDASYMVSRIEIIDLIKSDEKIYRRKLCAIFESKKDDHFLSEFKYAIPYIKSNEIEILKRFFIFIEFSYKYQRDMPVHSLIKSLADYQEWEPVRQKLLNVLAYLYRKDGNEHVQESINDFTSLCKEYKDINILFVCLNIISNQLGYFIFSRKYIDDTCKTLADRFYNEKIENSEGKLEIQEIDTIIQIRKEYNLRDYWVKLFEKFMTENLETCLNLLSRLVIFYDNGNIEWNEHFKNAILGESPTLCYNLVFQLEEVYPAQKEIWKSLLTLHHNFRSLLDCTNLNDSAFIKMAKERQNQSSRE